MTFLLGGAKAQSINTSAPVISSLRLQTSAYGRPIAWVFGRTRLSGNLLDYIDFTAIPHTTTTSSGGGGGKGGGGEVTSTDTTYTYRAAVIIGLARGPLVALGKIWKGKELQTSDALGLSFYLGDGSQVPFGYMETNHPERALGYRGIAYVASGAYDLGDNAELPQHTFEVQAEPFSGSIVDANVKDVLTSVLIDGLGWSGASVGDLSAFSDFCVANGIFVSPAYIDQEPYQEVIERLMRIGNAGALWSEDKLKVVPFGDKAVTGNGVTYTPNLTPLYDLTDDDFLDDGDDEPVRVRRATPEDAWNQVTVKFYNRVNDYNEEPAVAQDLGNIQLYGLKPMEPIVLHEICDAAAAQHVADMILRRELYTERNVHEFRLGWKHSLLESGDLLTVPDPSTGAEIPVRLWTIDEDPVEGFQCEAKEFPFGGTAAAIYGSQAPGGYSADFNVDPGDVNAPIIFIAPFSLTPNWLEAWIALSGGAEFGGCEIWVSEDDATYKRIGTFGGTSRMGVTTSGMNVVASPDNTTVLGVNLSQSGGEILSGTEEDANRFNTLCYAGGELISYRTATLTAANQYNVTGLRRGVYGSEPRIVPAGAPFARLDEGTFKTAFPPEWNGREIFLKFVAFNRTGGGLQAIDEVSPYVFTLSQQYAGLPVLRDVNGLELFGQGVGTMFTGRDAKFIWRIASNQRAFDIGSEPFGAGSGGIDPYWKDYQVEVWRADGSARLRTEWVIDNFYIYTYEKNFEDTGGAPVRAFEIRVLSRGNQGQLSRTPATLAVENPQPALPSGVSVEAAFKYIFFEYTAPADTDLMGILVWLSTTPGFTPDDTNLVYEGSNTLPVIAALPNTDYYLRYAAFDTFDKLNVALSGELAVSTGMIQETDIGPDSISTPHLKANIVTAEKMFIEELAAITAIMGDMTAGSLTMDDTGFIKGGQSGYDTGHGFWLGYDVNAYKFSIRNLDNKYLRFGPDVFEFGGDVIVTGNLYANSVTDGAAASGSGKTHVTENTDVLTLTYTPFSEDARVRVFGLISWKVISPEGGPGPIELGVELRSAASGGGTLLSGMEAHDNLSPTGTTETGFSPASAGGVLIVDTIVTGYSVATTFALRIIPTDTNGVGVDYFQRSLTLREYKR